MIPQDKFGNKISPNVYAMLINYGKILGKFGYAESKNKPNLFYKRFFEGIFFADMRSTGEVPIWEDTSPLFYWNFKTFIPNWKRRRMIKKELLFLFEQKCPCRLANEFWDCTEFENSSCMIDEDEGFYYWDDGYCKLCGKDFQQEGEFCSQSCSALFDDLFKKPCCACGLKMERRKEIKHHVSYFPEKIVLVHASCHNKIHKTDQYPNLKPNNEEINKYYKR
jgi:hypothetical protein